jgi:hypothetical protein
MKRKEIITLIVICWMQPVIQIFSHVTIPCLLNFQP